MIRIFNTLSRTKEDFKPLIQSRVGLYTCGPTVYNYAHIGNLRTYIFEDILQRVLEYNGYKVKRVMNITDVGHLTSDEDAGEDKLEKEAKKEGRSVWEIAKFYTNWFIKNLKDLNIKVPSIIVPATKTIPDQIKIIEILIKKGFAYETSKAVYFEVSKFKNYTQLSKQPINEKIIAARTDVVADPEKKHPADFALWFKLVDKFKNHTMRWTSPWGEGFPGWHIECSAISTKFLGQPFDIHAGGVDHVPVHHTNEIAQSEAAFDKPLANYWVHGEFLAIDKNKMSKSLNNFMTLEDLKKEGFSPLAYRYLILNAHYRSHMDFNWESMESAKSGYLGLVKNMALLKKYKSGNTQTGNPTEADKHIEIFKNKFKESINDDLNMPKALASLHDLFNSLNLMSGGLNRKNACRAYKEIDEADCVLGLKLAEMTKIPPKIRLYSWWRELLRNRKQFAKSDPLRKKIEGLGYIIEDTQIGQLVFKK